MDSTAALINAVKPRRRWFQFSLRTLLLMMLVFGCGLGWYMEKRLKSQREWQAIKRSIKSIQQDRGFVKFDNSEQRSGHWVEKKLGIDLPGKTSVTILCTNHILESGELYKMKSVQELQFYAAYVTDEDLKELAKLPELRSITTNPSSITAEGLAHFREHPHLETLGLDGSKMTDADLEMMDLPNLRSLSLRGTAISDAGVASLTKLSKLETLDLSHTKVTDACIDSLLQMPNLHVIGLDETAVTDAGLARLQGKTGLRSVTIPVGISMDAPGVVALQKSLPNLRIHQSEAKR